MYVRMVFYVLLNLESEPGVDIPNSDRTGMGSGVGMITLLAEYVLLLKR